MCLAHLRLHQSPNFPILFVQAMKEELRLDGRSLYDWRPLKVQVCR